MACGELLGYADSGRKRGSQGIPAGMASEELGAEKGSSASTSRVVVTPRDRGGARPGLSSEEMDIDEPNEWSSS